MPDTLRALSDGRIDETKAHTILAATMSASPAVAALVEQRVLPDAATVTSTTLRRRCERAVIAIDPGGAEERHSRRVRERYVSRWPASDGMAGLAVYSSAQDIAAIHSALTVLADASKRPGDGRDLGNRRVDALVGLCTEVLTARPARGHEGRGHAAWRESVGAGPPARRAAPRRGNPFRAQIRVTMPLTALLGSDEPCELSGHGPITAEQARAIAADGFLTRLVCDPLSGTLLDYGRTRYEPPATLKNHIRARDGECVMPICNQPATRSDIDHVTAARLEPGTGLPTDGATSADNLAAECRHHHLAKDADGGYRLTREPDGGYEWTTPLGRQYRQEPNRLWHPPPGPNPRAFPSPPYDQGLRRTLGVSRIWTRPCPRRPARTRGPTRARRTTRAYRRTLGVTRFWTRGCPRRPARTRRPTRARRTTRAYRRRLGVSRIWTPRRTEFEV